LAASRASVDGCRGVGGRPGEGEVGLARRRSSAPTRRPWCGLRPPGGR